MIPSVCSTSMDLGSHGLLKNKEPMKIWELEPSFLCPVLGICLTPQEQYQLLKRMGLQTKKLSPFETHELLVGSGASENRFSHKIDHFLRHKFRRLAAELAPLDEDALLNAWEQAMNSGTESGIFWVAMTRPNLSPAVRLRIFGDMHMAMHATVTTQSRLRCRLQAQEQEMATLRKRLQDVAAKFRAVRKEAQAATEALKNASSRQKSAEEIRVALEQEVVRLQGKNNGMQQEEENRQLRRDILMMTERLSARELQIQELQGKIAVMGRHKDSQDAFLREGRRMLEELQEPCPDSCPAYDLCRKRILIVGGIARMEAQYRRLVEDRGGIFEYHDGSVRNGTRQLEERLRRADVVLCPVNCNSHAACLLVKHLGKKYQKPVHMLENVSLHRVSRAMEA